jgi:hypothetical protein
MGGLACFDCAVCRPESGSCGAHRLLAPKPKQYSNATGPRQSETGWTPGRPADRDLAEARFYRVRLDRRLQANITS